MARPVDDERDLLRLETELFERDRLGVGRRLLVDHRRPRLELRRRCPFHGYPALALNHPRRDPELAELEIVVRLDQHARGREQHIALAARVLGEVVLELRLEGRLVGLELLTVAGREIDRVLVRDVDARDGDHPVVVHLLDKLARELDRLHVCPERAAEDALEQSLELLLDRAENGH